MTTNHRVAIQGTALSFEINETDTLLSGLLRQSAGIPYECNAGGCGSCKYTLIEGDIQDDLDNSFGLKASERRKNKHLACISHLKSDCVIQIKQDNSYIPIHSPTKLQAKLISRTSITDDLWQFIFWSQVPAVFLPGQYAKLFIPGVNGPRSFSMSNIENDQGYWEFLIKNTPGGSASQILFADDIDGLEVELDAPYSIAHLNSYHDGQIICIAGGSGLAPMISILRGIYNNHIESLNPVLYYGARTENDVVPNEYFSFLPEFVPTTQYFPVVSETTTSSNWSGSVGFIHDHIDDHINTDQADQEIFIAGPPPMVEAVRRHLVLDLGLSVNQLHYDRFF